MTNKQRKEHKSLSKSLRKESVTALRNFAAAKLEEAAASSSPSKAAVALASARSTLATKPY